MHTRVRAADELYVACDVTRYNISMNQNIEQLCQTSFLGCLVHKTNSYRASNLKVVFRDTADPGPVTVWLGIVMSTMNIVHKLNLFLECT